MLLVNKNVVQTNENSKLSTKNYMANAYRLSRDSSYFDVSIRGRSNIILHLFHFLFTPLPPPHHIRTHFRIIICNSVPWDHLSPVQYI